MTSLTGIDGSNLLGFLAALGTVRVLGPDARMNWKKSSRWVAEIEHPEAVGPEPLLDLLEESVARWQMPPLLDSYLDTNKFEPNSYRDFCGEALAQNEICALEWLAALACPNRQEKEFLQDTGLRTMSGAGAQHFLKTIRDLKSKVERKHLKEALFGPWTYSDPKLTLRYDPQDDRRSALRWSLAGDEATTSCWGANLLAGIAVGAIPSLPIRSELRTIGFSRQRGKPVWRWPIWTEPLSLPSILSLLALREIQRLDSESSSWVKKSLWARGVAEVFQSRRLTIGKIRNFSPSEPL